MTSSQAAISGQSTQAVDPFVQEWIAGTNGNLYLSLINRLTRYPIPDWPGERAASPASLLLDIGCGWGRWSVSAGRAGYIPVGIDIKVDPLLATRRVLKAHNLRGYAVAADLRELPFAPGMFDCVYSYSVLQHTHRKRTESCLKEISNALRPGGAVLIEFPLRHGMVNWRHMLKPSEEDDPESWCVRYYSWGDLTRMFKSVFGNASIFPDCYLGIGVRPEDIDILPWKYKAVVVASEALKKTAKILPPLAWVSDSVFVRSRNDHARAAAQTPAAERAPDGVSPDSNAWIFPWLRCPVSKGRLEYDRSGERLICRESGLAYPVVDEIPVLNRASATPL